MKKIIAIFSIFAVFTAGCSESFLDSEPMTQKVDANYYQTYADAEQALTGCYDRLNAFAANPINSYFLTAELMSDDRFGGGGQNDIECQAISTFRQTNSYLWASSWKVYYEGIFRCNMLISKLDQIKWENDAQRNKIEGQVRFLRAFYYFDMARMWGNVPLVTTPVPVNNPKASADEIFAQIATDLKIAIEKSPNVKFQEAPVTELGRATKWAAEGLMARVFLFYTGLYKKSDLPLVEGGNIAKSQVITWIEDCIANSGHGLISDFRNLWPYSITKDNTPGNSDYKFVKDNNLNWIDETGNNKETVFAVKFSTLASWSTSIGYGNEYVLYFGLRSQAKYETLLPFGMGWGQGTVNPQLWDDFETGDKRKEGSILNTNDLSKEGLTGFSTGGDKQYHETGFWNKKYMPINMLDGTGTAVTYPVVKFGATANNQLMHTQDYVLMRYSDILLMAAELGSTNGLAYLNQVRTRAGLAAAPSLSLDVIKKERRHELAFEGIRYYDLMRWGDIESAMAKVTNIPVLNNNLSGKYSKNYRPATKGFVQIPNKEILLSNGVLKQNDGWSDAESKFVSGK